MGACHNAILPADFCGFENVGEIDKVTRKRETFDVFRRSKKESGGRFVRLVAMLDPTSSFRTETSKDT
jgi:kynurenine formamidase